MLKTLQVSLCVTVLACCGSAVLAQEQRGVDTADVELRRLKEAIQRARRDISAIEKPMRDYQTILDGITKAQGPAVSRDLVGLLLSGKTLDQAIAALKGSTKAQEPFEFPVSHDLIDLLRSGKTLDQAIVAVTRSYDKQTQQAQMTIHFVTQTKSNEGTTNKMREVSYGAQGHGTLEQLRCIALAAASKRYGHFDHLLDKYLKELGGSVVSIGGVSELAELHALLAVLGEESRRYAEFSDDHRRTLLWNSSCSRLAGKRNVRTLPEVSVKNMFLLAPPDELRVIGQITRGFTDDLASALETHPDVKVVSFSSTGGSVLEAMRAGRAIRSRGLYTALYGDCDSACATAYFGGVKRWFDYGEYTLGFHDLQTHGRVADKLVREQVYVRLGPYLDEMGVNKKFVLQMMQNSSIDMRHVEEAILIEKGIIADATEIECDDHLDTNPLLSLAGGNSSSRTSRIETEDLDSGDSQIMKRMVCTRFKGGDVFRQMREIGLDVPELTPEQKGEYCKQFAVLPVLARLYGCN